MSNNIIIIGNLTSEPELRFTQGGRAFVSFGLADNRRYMVNNEWKEEVSFHNCTLWGEAAENAAASLTKGARIIASGRVQQREYDNKDGVKVKTWDFVIDEIGPSLRWARATVEKVVRDAVTTTQGPAAAGRPSQQQPPSDYTYAPEDPF
jgi:single-strand DNA-binding protein